MRSRLVALAAMAMALLAVACVPQPGTGGGSGSSVWTVDQHDTDPALGADPVNVNRAFAPWTTVTAKNKLVVVFPGTSAQTSVFNEVVNALTSDGYHVIVLRYQSALGTTQACPDAELPTNPDCHRQFRSEVVFGENVNDPNGNAYDLPVAHVNQAYSTNNRIIKLLDWLVTTAPTKGWAQFQQRSGTTCTQTNATYGGCEVKWSKVSLLGHSQGAGVAMYLSKFFPVSALGMLSGPYDGIPDGGGGYSAAPWTTEPLAIPDSKVTVLNHPSDDGWEIENAVADAIPVVGAPVNVATQPASYGGSRRLYTDAASTCPWDGSPSHNSTAVDLCAPDGLYVTPWRYMAAA